MVTRLQGDISLDTNIIKNEHVNGAAGIVTSKMRHAYRKGTNFDLAIGATPVAREEIVFVARAAGTLKEFAATLNVTGSSTSVSFDLKVNGSSVLSSVITITDADGNGSITNGTISSATLAADDIVSIEMTVSSSTGAQGPFAIVSIEENDAA